MEVVRRKPFQGITNIIRFNWHFYVLAIVFIALLHIVKPFAADVLHPMIGISGLLIILSIVISLIVSFYVYDLSGLYKFDWLSLSIPSNASVVNINAGFDETSFVLKEKYPSIQLTVLNFYNPEKHTEVSIKRARKAYGAYSGTKTIETSNISLAPNSIDFIFCVLSAHEIRARGERKLFFEQLNKAMKHDGRIIVVEHLRDVANFLAYNIGFFHFHSKNEWKRTFEASDLSIEKQLKITPFIKAFILQKNGASS